LRYPWLLWLTLILCPLSCLPAQAQSTGSSQTSAQVPVTAPISQYSLPPDKLAKAQALYTVRTTLHFVETIYGLALLLFVLHFHLGARFRSWAEGITRVRFFQAFLFVPVLTLVLDGLSLPFGIYGHTLSLRYGLSVQRWGSWLWDWTKGELIGMFLGSLLVWLLYAVIRKSPARWWFYGWLAILPILVFFIFLMPVVLDPLFNKFEPLEKNHADLVQAIQKVTTRGGLDIPPDRMFLMKASEKVTTANAYVTGIGATKRVVVWDTTTQQMTIPQTLFVFGHEMGHYMLHHIPKGLTFAAVLLFLGFYVTARLIGWTLARWGGAWHVRDLSDWASFPALMLIASLIGFVAEPISNSFGRHIEHQADVYGLNITSGINPEYRQVAAQSFQSLGEHSLSYPYPSKLMVFWLYDHPDITSRVDFALHYQPGKE
jgi:STE24 endopeptidase